MEEEKEKDETEYMERFDGKNKKNEIHGTLLFVAQGKKNKKVENKKEIRNKKDGKQMPIISAPADKYAS